MGEVGILLTFISLQEGQQTAPKCSHSVRDMP